MSTTTSQIDQLTGDYTLDQAHTRIGFVARHAMVTKVRGAFNEFEGNVHIDAQEPTKSSARLAIQAKSIDTRNEQRDAHLRSNDFLSLDQYPEIVFQSAAVTPVDSSTFRISGDLTIKDVTKPVEFDLEHTGSVIDPWGNLRLGFEGSLTINRKDWGVNWNTALEAGGVLVSEKVTLEFEVAAVKVS